MTPAAPSPAAFDALRNRRGERLDAAFHPAAAPSAASPAGGTDGATDGATAGTRSAAPGTRGPALALLVHGVTSSKDRPYLVQLADALSAAGIAALRFSFAGNGRSQGRFQDATPSREAEDLGCVLDAAGAAGFTRIACVGHSMGAAVGLLRAVEDPRITALVSLAGMLHVERFMARHFGALRPGEPMLGRAECPWSAELGADAARLGSLTAQAAVLAIPWLLVHGTADELVPLQDSLDARAAAGGRPDLVALPGADHRFTGATGALAAAVRRWLLETGLR